MVLYHVITYYQLMWVMAYHMTRKKDSKAIIIMANSLENRLSKDVVERLRNAFEIHFFPYDKMKDYLRDLTDEELSTNVTQQAIKLYDEHIKYDLNEFEEINVAGYHFYFSLILLSKGIKFNIIEEAAGMLSRHHILYSIVENLNPFQLRIALHNNLLYGDNELIQNRFCRVECQEKDYEGKNLCDYDLMVEIKNNDELKDLLLNIFMDKDVQFEACENSVLLLTQHFANLKILSFEEQALIYQYVVDYFYQGKKLIIKPHPDDWMFYSKLFPDADIIRDKFPSELLPFLFKEMPGTVSTVSSTAIFSVESAFNNVIKFSTKTEKDYKYLNRYYMAISTMLKIENVKTLQCLECDMDIVRNIVYNTDIDGKDVEIKECQSIDEVDFDVPLIMGVCPGDYFTHENVMLANKAHSMMIISCDYNYDQVDLVVDNVDNVTPIYIKKSKICDRDINTYYYDNEADETIYFASVHKELRKVVNELEIQKELDSVGVQIDKVSLDDKDRELLIVKGILKSTEQRLKYALNKNVKLEAELAQLKLENHIS